MKSTNTGSESQLVIDELNAALETLQRVATGELDPGDPVLADLPFPFWTKDIRGRYVTLNSAFEKLNASDRMALLGKTDFEITDRVFAEVSRRQDLQVLTSEHVLTFDLSSPFGGEPENVTRRITKVAIRTQDGQPLGIAGFAYLPDSMEHHPSKSPAKIESHPDGDQHSVQSCSEIFAQFFEGYKIGGPEFAVIVFEVQFRKFDENVLSNVVPCSVFQALARRYRKRLNGRGEVCFAGANRLSILLPDVSNLDVARKVAREMSVESVYPIEDGDVMLQIVTTHGVALVGMNDGDPESILSRALAHQTAGSRAGGADVPDAQAHRLSPEFELQGDMASGIDRQEFIAYFQPKMDLNTQQVIGAEALVRWKHPKRGLIPPSMFIAMAEQIGLQQAINLQIWRQSLSFIQKLNENSPCPKSVAINISAADLQVPEFLTSIQALLAETQCPASFVEFEITESALKGRSEQLESHLAGLADMGIGLAIDDFGTGNLAFEALNRFPIRTLKIDRVFVKDIATEEKTARLVRSMCLMADELGMTTVAEGVETRIESELAKNVGCKQGQGFFWQRPVPAQLFFEWLEQRTVVQ